MSTDASPDDAVLLLPPFDAEAWCPKCLHIEVATRYEPNTKHYRCPTGERLRTSYGPEHFVRTCQRCHFQWEEATLG